MARLWVSETAAVEDIAIEMLGAIPGERVLEIGLGPGRTVGRPAAAGRTWAAQTWQKPWWPPQRRRDRRTARPPAAGGAG